MIAHDGIRLYGDRETFGDQVDTVLDPDFPVLERASGVAIEAAEECASNAALDAVKAAGASGRYELRAGLRHGIDDARLA